MSIILFSVGIGLRQGCPFSAILFVIFIDRLSKCSQGEERVQCGDHRVASLLFADDVVLMASSQCNLQHTLGELVAEYEVGHGSLPENGGLPPLVWE